MNHDCDNLDAYLDGDLAPDETAHFAAHLDACLACRGAVDEQRWIDGLLRSPAIAEFEPPPPALVESFRTSLGRRRQLQRIRLAACGLAAAAAVFVAVGLTAQLNRQADGPTDDDVGRVAQAQPVDEPALEPPRATFVGGPDVIVVPVESRYPNVTIVRVYQVYQPEYAAQANLDRSTPGDEFAWPDLNGG